MLERLHDLTRRRVEEVRRFVDGRHAARPAPVVCRHIVPGVAPALGSRLGHGKRREAQHRQQRQQGGIVRATPLGGGDRTSSFVLASSRDVRIRMN